MVTHICRIYLTIKMQRRKTKIKNTLSNPVEKQERTLFILYKSVHILIKVAVNFTKVFALTSSRSYSECPVTVFVARRKILKTFGIHAVGSKN